METSEKIVEAYVRYVKGWATIPNIRCESQREIDILAINPVRPRERYHIEVGVSVSGAYSRLTDKPFSADKLKVRVQQAKQRATFGYFVHHKFEPKEVLKKLAEYGFKRGSYRKVVVTWCWSPEAEKAASRRGVELWAMPDLLRELAVQFGSTRSRLADDTIRTLQLYHRGTKGKRKGAVSNE